MSPKNRISGSFWPRDGKNRAHVPAMPLWIGITRILQFVLAGVVLALTASAVAAYDNFRQKFGLGSFNAWDGYEGYPVTWLAFAWTLFYMAWLVIALMVAPVAYNYWAHLVTECITMVFWFVSFALLSKLCSDLSILAEQYAPFIALVPGLKEEVQSPLYRTYVATGLEGLVGLLFALTLIVLSISVHRLRTERASDLRLKSIHTTSMHSPNNSSVLSEIITHPLSVELEHRKW